MEMSEGIIHVFSSRAGISGMSCPSRSVDAQNTAAALEKSACNPRLGKISKRAVEVLLDISEENSVNEQEPYEIPNQTGWGEAIQGWGRFSPFSCLYIAHQSSKKLKPESSASHCVLCRDLKELKISDDLVPCHAASEASCAKVPSSQEHPNRIPSAIAPSSSSEDDRSLDFIFKEKNERKDLLGNKRLLGPELSTPDKLLPHPPHPDTPCLDLRDRNVEKMALLGRVMVLPPVKVPTNLNVIPKRPNIFKRRDYSTSRAVLFSEDVDEDRDKVLVISHFSPTIGTSQRSVPTEQGPTQCRYQLLPASCRYQIPISTLAETPPSAASPLEPNLRNEARIRSPVRGGSGPKSRLRHTDKSLRRPEPELPMLLGTRVQIPVSTQRLL